MKTFEEYLKEEHAKSYTGTDDDMPYHFDRWLIRLDVDEWIMYGRGYGTWILEALASKIINK